MSLLTLVASGAAAALAWYILWEVDHHASGFTDVSSDSKIVVIVAGSIFTVIALISLFGFIGAIGANRRFIKAYSALVWVVFLLTLAGGGVFLYAVFSGKTKNCEFTDDQGNKHSCALNLKLWEKVVATVAVVVDVFITLYVAVVIGRYAEQLDDSRDYYAAYSRAESNPKQGLLNPTTQYPYSDNTHSFGAQA
ncbi:hypothetical protein CERSUDRAFT_84354 [Gelatoporia subvermispora B]|uniref:Uncharacterized protein n=1 Tax=Ceriporiopsis subvermispora (strain B) TaxID=914234 RepID=M2RCV9_CERS8|nr:hypothetical protein CERSUDRAFT_84354 [Gelatoporia subvermispora B]